MQPNNQFSITRFMILFKQSLTLNKRLLGIILAGVSGTLFVTLFLLQSASKFKNWDQSASLVTFIFFFFTFGIIYTSLSFNAFRSKEKTVSYLMLPVSNYEKFLFELFSRIVTFIIIMPPLYLAVANIEGVIVNHYIPDLINYKFSFVQAWHEITRNNPIHGWTAVAYINGGIFAFIAAFTGASFFSKSPLVKTLFVFSIAVCGYALFAFLLIKGLNLKEYQPSNNGILFIKNKDQAIAAIAAVITVTNLSLLAMSWFRLKEKEA